jgi:hypothetical protein
MSKVMKSQRRFSLRRLDVVVELEREHEQPLVGIQPDRAVVDRDRDRGLEREDENEAVVKRAAALRPVQVGGGAPAEADDVVGKRQRRCALPVQRTQRRRQKQRQFLERKDADVADSDIFVKNIVIYAIF